MGKGGELNKNRQRRLERQSLQSGVNKAIKIAGTEGIKRTQTKFPEKQCIIQSIMPQPKRKGIELTRIMRPEGELDSKSLMEQGAEITPLPAPGNDDGKPLEPGTFRGIILWEGEGPLPPGPKFETSTAVKMPPAADINQTVLILPEMPKDIKEKVETKRNKRENRHDSHARHDGQRKDLFMEKTMPDNIPDETQKKSGKDDTRTTGSEGLSETRTPERTEVTRSPDFKVDLDEEILVEAQYRFMFNMIESWEKQTDVNDNFITSPVSLHTVLTMLMLGCKNNTFENIKTSLGLEQMVRDKVLRTYQKLLQELHNTAWSKECFVGNALIANNTMKIEQTFNETLQTYFKNHIIQEDFTDQTLANKVNFWTKKNTNKRIDDVVKTIEKDYKLIALSAVYFEAIWSTAYDKKETKPITFTNHDQTPAQVKAMCAKKRYKSNDTKYGVVIFLPYKRKSLQFTIFLPNEEMYTEAGSLAKFIRNIGPKTFQSLFTVTNRIEVDIAVPKFIFESKHQNWKAILSNAGFAELFETPDMTQMFTSENDIPKLNDFMHTAVIKIDETGIHTAESSVSPRKPVITLRFDRPFFCMLSHKITKAPIFIGLIQKF